MRLNEVQATDVFDSNNRDHLRMMADIDHFTASPNTTLDPKTIEFLAKRASSRHGAVQLFRVLFTDDISQMSKMLNITNIDPGNRGMHQSSRPTSWTSDIKIVQQLVASDDMDESYAVVVKSVIDRSSILLDTSELSPSDLQHIYLFDQKESIVSAGSYPIVVMQVVDRVAA